MSGLGTITFNGLDGKFNLTHNMEIAQNLVDVPITTSDSTIATTAFVHLHMPTGMVVPYAGSSAPSGWLLCDGREVAKADYPALWSVIGSTYGVASDPYHNFVLPNLGGRTVIGTDRSNSLAHAGGNASVTLSTSNLPAHSHTGTTDANGTHSHSVTDPGHSHNYGDAYFAENQGGPGAGYNGSRSGYDDDNDLFIRNTDTSSNTTGISIQSAGSHTHIFTTNNTGSGTSFSILPPHLALNYLIKAV